MTGEASPNRQPVGGAARTTGVGSGRRHADLGAAAAGRPSTRARGGCSRSSSRRSSASSPSRCPWARCPSWGSPRRVATRTLTTAEALSGFSNSTVWLVVTAFFIAAGFIKTGLGARIAYSLVASSGGSTLGLGYSLVAADLVLAPAIPSNTARAGGVIFPILQSLAKAAPGSDPVRGRPDERLSDARRLQRDRHHERDVPDRDGGQSARRRSWRCNQGIAITWSLWALAAVVPGVVSLIVVPAA